MNPSKKYPLYPLFSAAVLIFFTVVLGALCIRLSDPSAFRIMDGTRVAGMDLGGMTRNQAKSVLRNAADALRATNMVILLPEETLVLTPEATEVKLQISKAVWTAYSRGRNGTDTGAEQAHDVNILPCLEWDEDSILSALEAYAEKYNTTYADSIATIEGSAPELEEGQLLLDHLGQTLVVTLGTPGFSLDVDGLYGQILDAYSRGIFLVDWSNSAPQSIPEIPNLDTLHQQYCTEPTDAVLDWESHSVIPASYGYCFDAKQAQKMIDAAEYGQTIRLPLEYVDPQVKSEDLLFRDVLGTYTSGHSDRPNIVTNLDLVCQLLNGIVIQPGEIFSYNDTIGERTVERGFMYGESFSGFERTRSAGGGVCQGVFCAARVCVGSGFGSH